MTAISTRLPAVAIEYDSRNKRATRKFKDANDAKAFYIEKDKLGKQPRVVGERQLEWGDDDKPAAEPKAPREKFGVNPKAKTRAGCAGRVVAKHGLAGGVTEEMIAECGELYGKPLQIEDSICVRNAWHAVTAYLAATVKE